MSQVLQVDSVVLTDPVGKVGEQWDLEGTETAVFPGRVHPREMRKVRVYRACHHLCTQLAKLLDPIVEGQDLRRADKRAKTNQLLNKMKSDSNETV